MVSTAITAAIISGATTLIVCLINNYFLSTTQKEQNDKQLALLGYRLEEMEKKQDKHNHVVERLTIVERDVKTAFSALKEIKDDIHKIEEHEREHEKMHNA